MILRVTLLASLGLLLTPLAQAAAAVNHKHEAVHHDASLLARECILDHQQQQEQQEEDKSCTPTTTTSSSSSSSSSSSCPSTPTPVVDLPDIPLEKELPITKSSKTTNNNHGMNHHQQTDLQGDELFWPTSRELPIITPGSKTILFVAHFFVSTDVNHMLLMATELRARGHTCHFIVMEPYVKRVEAAGFLAIPTPNVLQGAGLATIQRAFSYASHETGWLTYIYKYIYGIAPLAAQYYEPCLTIVQDYLQEAGSNSIAHGKPDLLVSSKASEAAIDVAWHYQIPLSVLFTMPLGGMVNAYEDTIAAPDANLWGSLEAQATMTRRLRKILAWNFMFLNPITAYEGSKIAYARYQHGFNPAAVPGDHWKKAMIISPWSMGIDLARNLRPLTQLVGFMTTPQPALPQSEQELATFSSDDQSHLRYLNEKTDGVVFCAFGSLAVLTQEWFDELVAGMDLWARTRSTAGNNNTLTAGGVIAVNDLSLKAGLDITSNIPSTVQVTGWINQKLFLAHPHTRAFITHGGLGSLGESIQARVPMLVFPLFFDQPNNAHRLTEAGVALNLHFREESVTAAKVASRLSRLTTEPSFAYNLERQYQISVRAGGIGRAADLLEDILLWKGNLDHLIPVTERAGFFQRTNADLLVLFLTFLVYVIRTLLSRPIVQRYRVRFEMVVRKHSPTSFRSSKVEDDSSSPTSTNTRVMTSAS